MLVDNEVTTIRMLIAFIEILKVLYRDSWLRWTGLPSYSTEACREMVEVISYFYFPSFNSSEFERGLT